MKYTESPLISPDIAAAEQYPLELVSLSELTESLSRFTNEYYRGAVEVIKDFESTELMRISPKGLAYFLKALLHRIHGKEKLKIGISIAFPHAVLKFFGCDLSFIDERLIQLARTAGFSVSVTEAGAVILAAQTLKNANMFVYAVSTDALIKQFVDAFCE